MRVQIKPNPFARTTNRRKKKSKIFFAFEGEKTEEKYLSNLIKKYNMQTLHKILYFSHISSNPKSIIDSLLCILKEESLNIQYEYLINLIVDYLGEKKIYISRDKIKSIVDKHASKNYKSLKDNFEKNKVNEIAEKLEIVIKDSDLTKLIISKELLNIIQEDSSYDEELDKIAVIVDRDSKSFTDVQYDDVLVSCKKENIHLFVTNPCIEFWFLLHHTDCKGLEQEVKENVKEENNNNFVYNLLKKYDQNYKKNTNDYNFYVENFDIAKNNSKLYANNLEELKDNIGTNLGEIINIFD